MSRLERLYAITEYLRRRRTAVTVADLAARFGVTDRTIHRDLAALRAQSVPIEGDPGRGGGLRLARDYSMPPVGLSVDEAVGLWLSYRLAALLGPVPAGASLAGAVDKVLGSLPEPTRRRLDAVLDRIVVGPPANPALAAGVRTDPEVLRACERAFVRGCRLGFAYLDRHGQRSARRVEPHGLLVQSPLWYVLAFDPERGAPRMFRADRMSDAALEPEARFDPIDPRRLFAEIAEYGLEVPE